MIAILMLAAGAARRMRGADKLTQEIGGEPLLRIMARRAISAELGPVVVVLSSLSHPRSEALKGLDLRLIPVADAEEGMGASIRAGARALTSLPPAEVPGAVMILPCDMPEITTDDLRRMATAHVAAPHCILRGASDDTPGHPVLFPRDFLAELNQLGGDQGARPVIAAHRDCLQLVPLPGDHAINDLDTPEEWAHWRSTLPR